MDKAITDQGGEDNVGAEHRLLCNSILTKDIVFILDTS